VTESKTDMPTYAYVCEQCGREMEAFQSITARPLRKCPQCGRASLKRLIGTGAGIIFKGSGFYCTDYRSDGYKTAVQKEAGASKDSKGETKPAAPAKPQNTAPKKKSA
jgi:putative FmdB family regulatory protein